MQKPNFEGRSYEFKTLHELNVQVGDVVRGRGKNIQEIRLREGEPWLWCLTKHDGTTIDNWTVSVADSHLSYALVSRAAKPGPVITETVTTQRIVPGAYGIVDLAGVDKDMVQIRLRSKAALKTWFTATELTAAIETLTKIRDAMAGEP